MELLLLLLVLLLLLLYGLLLPPLLLNTFGGSLKGARFEAELVVKVEVVGVVVDVGVDAALRVASEPGRGICRGFFTLMIGWPSALTPGLLRFTPPTGEVLLVLVLLLL